MNKYKSSKNTLNEFINHFNYNYGNRVFNIILANPTVNKSCVLSKYIYNILKVSFLLCVNKGSPSIHPFNFAFII